MRDALWASSMRTTLESGIRCIGRPTAPAAAELGSPGSVLPAESPGELWREADVPWLGSGKPDKLAIRNRLETTTENGC